MINKGYVQSNGEHMQLVVLTRQECEEMLNSAAQRAVEAMSEFVARGHQQKSAGKEYVSATELANLLGVTRETIFKWRKDEKYPAYKIGRKTLFDKEEVLQIIKGNKG